ncbi:hypothetical protein R5R35_003782 [Gryllus longicercus]|uniref:Reverse transcriptase domain-containing protein n=1 Tax=Gryllus longicercus TaxID=2509291 RepID=A0AAN9Z3A3_9ORTH
MGMNIGDETLFSLLFADDQVIMAEDEDDVTYMFRKLVEEYGKWGMEINLQKTEYMVVRGMPHDLETSIGIIKGKTQYKYLGVTLTACGRDEQDVKNKTTRGKIAIRQLNPVLWNSIISMKTKKRIYSSFIESTTLYGAEVWTLSKKLKDKFQSTEMMFWRRCCKHSLLDKIRNDEIRNKMKVQTTLNDTIEMRQLKWYGHMRRLKSDRLPQKVWEWIPNRRRYRGRPRRTWNMAITEAMEKREMEENDVWDKEAWKLECGKRPSD